MTCSTIFTWLLTAGQVILIPILATLWVPDPVIEREYRAKDDALQANGVSRRQDIHMSG
jgi:hypothetical protein